MQPEEKEKMLQVLKLRFERNMDRHKDIQWSLIGERLDMMSDKLRSLNEMEKTGGEPDVVGYDKEKDEFIFYDCSAETPAGRRSLCYDREAWLARKKDKPVNTAIDMAAEMGVEILTESQYRQLQTLGVFDTKSSSWVKTPDSIRELGGAIFCDRRYDTVFVYHNGAGSYYADRGFRSSLKL